MCIFLHFPRLNKKKLNFKDVPEDVTGQIYFSGIPWNMGGLLLMTKLFLDPSTKSAESFESV